ncbi:MAG: hypothetical protein R3A10_12060 [Caldilineaceae bacterium]
MRTFFSVEQTRALLGGLQHRRHRQRLGRHAGRRHPVLLLLRRAALHRLCGKRDSAEVTFSFLIAAPMVNEIALAMLFGLFSGEWGCT